MQSTPIIAGIDPGLTTGFAAIDMDKNLIGIGSNKNLGLNELISKVHSLGKVILVATDKKNNPSFVDSFAAKFGARVITPRYDLKVKEKNELTKDFSFSDDHQKDALASALFAYNKYSNLIAKIKKADKKDNLDDLFYYVIKGELPINHALTLLKQDNQVVEEVKEEISNKRFDISDYEKILKKLKILEKENILLRNQNNLQKNTIKSLKKNLSKKENVKKKNIKIRSDKIDKLFSFKEKRIKELKKKIR